MVCIKNCRTVARQGGRRAVRGGPEAAADVPGAAQEDAPHGRAEGGADGRHGAAGGVRGPERFYGNFRSPCNNAWVFGYQKSYVQWINRGNWVPPSITGD